MKRFYILSIICAGVILFSLFLPYEEMYRDWGLTRNVFTDDHGEIKSGWKYFPFTIVPAIIIGLVAGLNAIRENVATALIGLLLSLGNLLYMGFIAVILTLNFGAGRSEIEIGYFIALLAVLIYVGVTSIHFIHVVRNRKNPKENTSAANDLLDREF